MSIDFQGSSQTTKIKILLWRQDYSLTEAISAGKSSSSGSSINDILIRDIEDFNELFPDLSWSKLIDPGAYKTYNENWKAQTQKYLDQLWNVLINHIRTVIGPFDISSAIIALDPITSSMGFENSFSFSVDNSLANIDAIVENDIIAVLIKRDNDTKFKVEYIGFVTAITNTEIPKQVNSYDITTFGLHKYLGLSRMIQLAGVWDQTEGTNEVTSANLQMFSTRWENKTVKEIVAMILEEIYNISSPTTVPTNITDARADIYKYEYSWENSTLGGSLLIQDLKKQGDENFKKIDALRMQLSGLIGAPESVIAPYQDELNSLQLENDRLAKQIEDQSNEENRKKYLRLGFLFLYAYYLVREDLNSSIIIPAVLKIPYEPLPKTIAIIERADINPYNSMIASNLQKFYSQLVKPIDILNNIKAVTFYDIFESRDGYLICRPPMYNKFGNDITDERGIIDLTVNIADKNKYIIEKKSIQRFSKSRNDVDIETRRDYKWTQRYYGSMDTIGGSYSDFLLTAKYGGRLDGPKDNVLCQTIELAALFSAIDLVRANTSTRQINITVDNDRKYELARLYYLPEYKRVGYLVNIVENFNLQQGVTQNTLTFTYIRKVEPIQGENNKYQFKIIPSIDDLGVLTSELMQIAQRSSSIQKRLQTQVSKNRDKKISGAAYTELVSNGYYYYFAKKTTTTIYQRVLDTSGQLMPQQVGTFLEAGTNIEFIQTPFVKGTFVSGGEIPETFMNQEFINKLNNADMQMLREFSGINIAYTYYDLNTSDDPAFDDTIITEKDFYRAQGTDPGSTVIKDDSPKIIYMQPTDPFNINTQAKKAADPSLPIPDLSAGTAKVTNLLIKNGGIIHLEIFNNKDLLEVITTAFNLIPISAYIYIQETKVPSISNIMGCGGLVYGFKTPGDSTMGITDDATSNPTAYDPHTLGLAIDIAPYYTAWLTQDGKNKFDKILSDNGLYSIRKTLSAKQEYPFRNKNYASIPYIHINLQNWAKGV